MRPQEPDDGPGNEPPPGPAPAPLLVTAGDPGRRSRLRMEVALVLGLSLGSSAISAVIALLADLTAARPLSSQTTVLVGSASPRPWVDLAYQVLGVSVGVLPALLVIYLLLRDGRRLPGLDLRDRRGDLLRGGGVALVIGAAGLGLYLAAHAVDGNLTVVPESLPTVWWRDPILVLDAATNGVLEECVVLGYLLLRLGQLGAGPRSSLAASALLRGAYHLYQGFGGFLGNAVMGGIFVLLYRRWGRVMPLVVAHTLIDIGAFLGYAHLVGRVSFLPH